MLSKPEDGWSDFQLDGTGIYGLSYLTDVPIKWLDNAIHGLETMTPFTVEGFLEPKRFLCTVSYWSCHIIIEHDMPYSPEKKALRYEISHVNMLEFCQFLYDDINNNFDEWLYFLGDYFEEGEEAEEENYYKERSEKLKQRLERLKCLLSTKAEHFGPHRCFF